MTAPPSVVSTRHIVARGEHLVGIACQAGLRDWGAVWDHPRNARLRARRGDPNVLAPGDEVVLPEVQDRPFRRQTGAVHVFVCAAVRLRLRVRLEAAYWGPLADVACKLAEAGQVDVVATDGLVDVPVAPLLRDATLSARATDPLPVAFRLRLAVGDLDPADGPSGQLARLSNLGYYRGAAEPLDPVEWRSAVEEFQCDHGLPVDGHCGPLTCARLLDAHGC